MYKSPVIDQTGGKTLYSLIPKLINFIWNKEELPQQWNESGIAPIYKKDGKTDCVIVKEYHTAPACQVIQVVCTYFCDEVAYKGYVSVSTQPTLLDVLHHRHYTASTQEIHHAVQQHFSHLQLHKLLCSYYPA
jgi:hypothetical protein